MTSSAGPSAIVLCGGTSRRFSPDGRQDKTQALLDDGPVLDSLLLALPSGLRVVCVGVERPTARPVVWCREDPSLGGPVAGIAAGLVLIDAGLVSIDASLVSVDTRASDAVVVLAGDQPFAGRYVAPLLAALADHPEVEGAVVRTGDHDQYLLGAYRPDALRRVVQGRANVSVRSTLATLTTVAVPGGQDAMDVDTPADLERARRHAAHP